MVFPIGLVSEAVTLSKAEGLDLHGWMLLNQFSLSLYKSSLLVCLKELDTKHLPLGLCLPTFQVFWLTLELRDNLVIPTPTQFFLNPMLFLIDTEKCLCSDFISCCSSQTHLNDGTVSGVLVMCGISEVRVCEVSWPYDLNRWDGLNVICPQWNSHGNLLVGASLLGEGAFSKC